MRNLILTVIVITTTLSPQVSYGVDGVGEFVQYNSTILESVGTRKQLFSNPDIQSSNAIQNNLDSGNAIPEEESGTVTAGGVLLVILIGALVGAMLSANKSSSGSNAPTSQQTLNVNK